MGSVLSDLESGCGDFLTHFAMTQISVLTGRSHLFRNNIEAIIP